MPPPAIPGTLLSVPLAAGRPDDAPHAAGQAVAGLAAGWVVLWALTAAFTAAAASSPNVGFPDGADRSEEESR